MFIVYWPIKIKFRIREQTSTPQTNYRCCLQLQLVKSLPCLKKVPLSGGAFSYRPLIIRSTPRNFDHKALSGYSIRCVVCHVTRAVKDCTYVIHVASPLPTGNPRNDMELIGPAVDGTKSVLEACAKTKGGVKRVVLTSSCGAIMGKKTGAIDTCKGKDCHIVNLVPRAFPTHLREKPWGRGCHIVTSVLIASKSLK